MYDDLKLTKSERETLKAVYRLTKGDNPAHTGDLAERLDVSPSTVTTTVKRLADRGLVEHRLYKGVELTKRGRREAVDAIRRHRIVERFLSDMSRICCARCASSRIRTTSWRGSASCNSSTASGLRRRAGWHRSARRCPTKSFLMPRRPSCTRSTTRDTSNGPTGRAPRSSACALGSTTAPRRTIQMRQRAWPTSTSSARLRRAHRASNVS